ncbi:MAG: hybrid sensor histidine kinase/response regulator, partial [Melioribacteraceae bacterium]
WERALISPIKNNIGRITHFLAVKEDITEWKNIQEELIRSKEEAVEASKLKSSLLANMSHEFRTPLNGVLGFAQLLKEEIADSDQLDMIDKIIQSGRRLMNTLNSVLMLTELENNNYLINKSEIDLSVLCKQLKMFFTKPVQNKNLDFILDLKEENLSIISDENLLTRVISSFIENAIKYTQAGEIKIELTSSYQEDGKKFAIINIIDTGIGIRTEDQSLIFREFKQLSEGFRRDFEGLGLGLTIANKITTLIGGKITLQSELGKGSKFTLMLPIETPLKADNVQTNQIFIEKEMSTKTKTQAENELTNVLLIEDNPLNIEVVQKFLSKICTVSFARDGLTAIRMSMDNDYSLIMIDINLGQGIDGVQVLHEIKKLGKYEGKPIIALTGYASDANKKEFLAHGFTHYLAKPFDKRELVKLVMDILNLN